MASRHGIQVIPKKVKTDEFLEVGGDYILRNLILHNYYGEKTNILPIVQELNIYESIYNNAITGTLVIGDTKNQIARLRLQYGGRFAIRDSNNPGHNFTALNMDSDIAKTKLENKELFICPEQVGKVNGCGDCGLCWASNKAVGFITH